MMRSNMGLGQCPPGSTTCPKVGIKIHESDNNYRRDPFLQQQPLQQQPQQNQQQQYYQQQFHPQHQQQQQRRNIDFHNTPLNELDMDIENYEYSDLLRLFNINANMQLTEQVMKDAKQIVLKMHPDKSRLDSKYFLFFSKAYKRLHSVYEFQNKGSGTKKQDTSAYDFDDGQRHALDRMFQEKGFKDDKGSFNSWFNTAFEKNRLENPLEKGYGDWLKSDADIYNGNETVTKGNMNEFFEKQKKQLQSVIVYNGINDNMTSSLGAASLLDGSDGNFTTEGYTDLRQAYTETLIPVTEEDYNKMQKFGSLNEYKSHRDRVDITALSKEEATRKLYEKEKQSEAASAALAYKYAQEAEKAKKNQQSFWADLKQLGW